MLSLWVVCVYLFVWVVCVYLAVCCLCGWSVSIYVCVWSVCTQQNGNTSLHVAAAEGHLDVIRYLLSSGLDANLQNKVCYFSVSIICLVLFVARFVRK